tara:strand:+ start:792 stop:2726 length:1935 start_codon:yes stop_codon:yes gene_type:complete
MEQLTDLQRQILSEAKNKAKMSPAQLDILRKAKQENPDNPPAVEKQRARKFFDGLTLGFGEEIEAGYRTFKPSGRTASNRGDYNSKSGQGYGQIRDNIRSKKKAYENAHQVESMAYEVGGGLTNALLTKSPSGVARIAGRGALEGGIAGYGYSEKDELEDTGKGAAIGAGAAGIGTAVFGGLGKISNKIISAARDELGDGYTNRLQNYLKDIVEQTGLTEDQVVAKIAQGETLSDDLQLGQTIKFLVSKGGFTQKQIQDAAKSRMKLTRDDALNKMQQSVTPDIEGGNIFAGVKNNFDNLKQKESVSYDRLFKETNPPVDDATAKQMLAIVQRSPESAKLAQDLSTLEGIVPFYTTLDNGAIDMIRQPSLMDAELLLRGVKDITDQSFRSSANNKGSALKSLAGRLQQDLDAFSPDLKATRANSAARFSGKEAYDLGRGKAFTMNPDELSTVVEDMSEVQIKNLRAGYLEGIKNKAFKKGSALADASNQDLTQGLTAKIVLGPDADDLIANMQRAANARRTNQIANPLSGSATAPQLQQESKMKSAAAFGDMVTHLKSGNFVSAVSSLKQVIGTQQPGLSDAERGKIAETLFSQDPAFVRQMLSGNPDTFSAVLAQKLNDFGVGLQDAATRGALVQQSSQYYSE